MRTLALILAILGITYLISLYFLTPIPKANSPEDLSSLKNNQRINIEGKVIEIIDGSYYSTILLENNLNLTIESLEDLSSLKDKNIIATAKISKFNNKTKLILENIKIK